MPKRSWIFAAALLLPGAFCSAAGRTGDRFNVEVWGTEKGLSSIITMTQTRDGYLWLGTPNGLVRFDGYHFTTFDENNTPGLDNNWVSLVFEDSRSNLWLGTQTGGIKLVKDGQVVTVPPEPGFRAGPLKSACEDASGAVWLYTADGKIIHYRNGKGVVWEGGPRFQSNRRMLVADRDGGVWMGLDRELLSTGTTSPKDGALPTNHVAWAAVDFLLASRRGGFWCLAGGHIQKWATNRMERDFGEYPWDRSVAVTSAGEDREGNLVVGTYGDGVYWFDSAGQSTRISTAQGLSANNVLSLVVDREDNLWVGTDGLGLNRVKRCVFGVLNESEQRTAQSICEDRDGGLWVGYNGGEGAVQYWKSGVEQKQFGTNQDLLVRSVFVDRDGRVWAGSWGPWDYWQLPAGGLFSLSSNSFKASFTRSIITQGGGQIFSVQAIQTVSAIYQDRKGQLWAGTRDGLVSGDGQNWKIWTVRDGLSSDDVRAIVEDAEGNLWIGTDGGGLDCLREGRFKAFHKQDGLPSEHISSLLVDREGALWIGSSGGLARWKKGRWTRFTTDDGLVSNSIGYLLEDGLGYLWIGSNLGLMRVEKAALDKFAENPTNSFTCRVFAEPDGLPSLVCTSGSQPAACRTRDGMLWFPTIKGLASVDPAKIKRNPTPPPVVIESVSVQDQPRKAAGLRLAAAESITVPAGNEHLDIQYTSLNLAGADETRFRYRMEPDQTRWVAAGDRRIAPYGKLAPGEYHFQVTACNEDGVWNETPATIAVVVLPPFWRQWWFISAVALGLLGTVVGVVHYISTQKLNRQLAGLRQQQALEQERARIARDIHDQLGASLTQVSLLGEMVESDKDSPGDVADHAKQISKTARDTARALDEIVWTVNPSNDTLDGLVTYICKYAQEYLAVAGLRYRLDVPAELPAAVISPEVRHNAFLAAKEAVTNVVRHARATSVFIRLRLEPAAFTLEIQDDGKGVADVEALKASSRNGLRNMGKRMEDVGGSFAISTAPEGGTLVRLTVPIKTT